MDYVLINAVCDLSVVQKVNIARLFFWDTDKETGIWSQVGLID